MYFKVDLTGFMFTSEFIFCLYYELPLSYFGRKHCACIMLSSYGWKAPQRSSISSLYLRCWYQLCLKTFNNEHSLAFPGKSIWQRSPYIYKHFPNT